jgi:SPP1 gp7 family putative phage head morphogenesis protein
MIETLIGNHNLSQERAEFLAREEARLFSVKLKQIRYEDAGVTQYRWCCVKGTSKHPVRHSHSVLNGKIFEWSNPPIVNEKGERKHPGEDEGCRCTAVPVVNFKK